LSSRRDGDEARGSGGTVVSGEPAALREERRDGVTWLETGGDGWRAAFSTRLGGVSNAPFRSLNLSLAVGDHLADVLENRRRLAAGLGYRAPWLVVAEQVHGVRVRRVGPHERGAGAGDQSEALPATDGLWTTEPCLPLSVSVADCVPVVLSARGTEERRAVATLHAGWRGMIAGILGQGVRLVGGVGPVTTAVIGPSIGPCCFAVGEEVGERFEALWPGSYRDGRVDLWQAAARQLEAAGVDAARIRRSGLCTVCDQRFFSHRREHGRTGRQMAVAWLEPGGLSDCGDGGGTGPREHRTPLGDRDRSRKEAGAP